jgi:polyadenylation factor subunit 2
MRDKYNLNTLPASLAGLEDYEMDDHISIPGMGSINEERNDYNEHSSTHVDSQNTIEVNSQESSISITNGIIPGLDLVTSTVKEQKNSTTINSNPQNDELHNLITKLCQMMPGVITLSSSKPDSFVKIYDKDVEVKRELNVLIFIEFLIYKKNISSQLDRNYIKMHSKALKHFVVILTQVKLLN